MNRNENYEDPRILITGGTGFVGPHLIRYLKPHASSISVLASGMFSDADPSIEYHSIDIRNREQVRSLVNQLSPTSIYHLAGISSVGASRADPRLAYEVNVSGTFNLFEAAMSLPSPPKILNVSTSQVDALSAERLDERSLVGPENPYAATKAMAELLAVQYRHAGAGGIVTARSFNHSGPGQTPGFFLSSVAKQFAEMESDSGSPKLAVGNLKVKRDFTDVRDVVRAYGLLLEKGKLNEVYNVCSGTSVCLADIVEMFQDKSGIKVAIETNPARNRSNDASEMRGDPRKLHDHTGWYPLIPLEQTVADLLEYWRSKSRESTVQMQR
jgi:GDP-4-dehydro-6-deoxy-D-mannose reductase